MSAKLWHQTTQSLGRPKRFQTLIQTDSSSLLRRWQSQEVQPLLQRPLLTRVTYCLSSATHASRRVIYRQQALVLPSSHPILTLTLEMVQGSLQFLQLDPLPNLASRVRKQPTQQNLISFRLRIRWIRICLMKLSSLSKSTLTWRRSMLDSSSRFNQKTMSKDNLFLKRTQDNQTTKRRNKLSSKRNALSGKALSTKWAL